MRREDHVAREQLGLAAWARRIEAPTWILVVTIYSCWLALTFCWQTVPFWLGVPAAAWLCAWHASLQHELIHGHPTRSERLNAALGWPPLNLWLPYRLYREQHLRHHRDAHLTDPFEDPESTYMSAAAWSRAGTAGRWLHGACNTLAGRVLLGPPRAVASFWLAQVPEMRRGRRWLIWGRHAGGVGLVLGWVCGVCGISFLTYVACFVYPGMALIMVRSLAEHRAAVLPEDRTAVVERAGVLGPLFLYNNLHVLHHECPAIPWFELPAAWARARTRLLATRRGPVFRGYWEVAALYAWRPHHPGPHPFLDGVECINLLKGKKETVLS